MTDDRSAETADPTRDSTVAFVGDESLVLQCAVSCRDAGQAVSFVSTRREEIRAQAAAVGFPTVDSSELRDQLAMSKTDVLFSIANEFVLGDDVLAAVDVAVNFHDGPLPSYAGLSVTNWALHEGETEHAVTWHTMNAEVDAGDIVVERRFVLAPDETAFSLNARCYEAALETFPDALRSVTAAQPQFLPQPPGATRWFGRYDRPVAFIDPVRTAADMDRSARAFDVGPRFRNRFGVLRLVVRDRVLLVGATRVLPSEDQDPGTVTVTPDAVRIATVDGVLLVEGLTNDRGDDLTAEELATLVAPSVSAPRPELAAALAAADPALARYETAWIDRLAAYQPSQPSHLGSGAHEWHEIDIEVPSGSSVNEIAAGVLAWWARTSGADDAWFSYSDDRTESALQQLAPLAARPLGRLALDPSVDWQALEAAVETEFAWLSERGPYLGDLVARTPSIRHRVIDPALLVRIGDRAGVPRSDGPVAEVTIAPTGDGLRLRIRASHSESERAGEAISAMLHSARAAPHEPVVGAAVIGSDERSLLDRFNDTGRDHDRSATIDGEFRRQAASTPDAPAVTGGGVTLTYAELERAVDGFAVQLRDAGAAPQSLVGILTGRDTDLLVAVLAVLSIGAAYVPLDPAYPPERLSYMMSDADLDVLVADVDVTERIAAADVAVISPKQSSPTSERPRPEHRASDLAYVIYTSGSTGRPKGVMLEHRNVVNFFAAMDDVIDHDPAGVWLAVTSLSFDISVLELLWTVTRGFHVVIQQHGITSGDSAPPLRGTPRRRDARATTLSLFFFAAGESQAADGYRLLRESAAYADENGFEAVWLPERHFHQFGGAYPNPSVLGAAVAASTSRIAIRAGSVVLPLHSSARVAEEWAVVDNLSGGRVGISFAPGWQPNDFVLNPTGYHTARDGLPARIDEVRALWRGEAVDMIGPDEQTVSVRTLPRPVQPELPVWLTSAGTTATFEKAGHDGLNLLTHLLGQSIDQLADNIAVYRAAWDAAGHPGEGHVTVMLHTFLDDDTSRAKQLAAEPLKQYLGTATGLLKNMASAFPTFAKAGASADDAFRSLTDAEMDELLTVAADRYLGTSGLFGSVADTSAMARTLSDIGADEIACLIDFGVDTDLVLRSLPMLGELKSALDDRRPVDGQGASAPETDAFSDLVERHSVTHVQCTPSLAAMLMADEPNRTALGSIRHLMVGGEALPEKLAKELRGTVTGRLTNMYGPTETTIWSLVHEIDEPPRGSIPIGRPIANTTVHVLDPHGTQVPIGGLGELHIGGEGVARGYLGREELTAERFVDRAGMGRVYATGDLARIDEDGIVEFAGRVDFQVKIRGHRIELGEIEAHLDLHPSVERSVVVARGDASDARLIGFVVLAPGAELDEALLRKHVASTLPDVMVPDAIVALEAMPLTPNGKVDRAALPTTIERGSIQRTTEVVAPTDDFERLVADAWTDQLHCEVGRTDNFFDLGGHSLLAVAVFRRLQEAPNGDRLALTDVFRYPTVTSFAAHLKQLGGTDASGDDRPRVAGTDRGALRRQMLDRRRGTR